MNGSKKVWNVLVVALIAALSLAGLTQAAEKSKLTDLMETINNAVKKLRKDVKKADLNKASAELAKSASEAATKCLEFLPETASKVPAAEKEKFIAEYKKQIQELAATFTELEKALLDNKNEDAEKIITKLLDQKKKGHDQFTE